MCYGGECAWMNAKWYNYIKDVTYFLQVESTTAKATAMALQLQTVHRWCVSGTPIQRGLDDIFGLLLFLKKEPFFQKAWWQKLVKVRVTVLICVEYPVAPLRGPNRDR